MDYENDLKLPVELASPVEFVLIGTFGTERGVLVQSEGATVDLIAHAQTEITTYSRTSMFSWTGKHTGPITARFSGGVPHIMSKELDHRRTELAFVWRGERGARKLDDQFRSRIGSCLAQHCEELYDSLYRGSKIGITWALAEALSLCKEHEGKKRRRRVLFNTIMSLVILTYIVAGTIVLLL